MDQEHIGWKFGKLIACTINATPSLFVAKSPSTYSQATWGNIGETRGGVGKSGVQEHESGNISLKRVKIEQKSYYGGSIGTHQRSFERYHPLLPSLLFPKIGCSFATPPKTSIAIISGTGKATNFKFGRYIHRVHPNKSPLNILEKRERGRIRGLRKSYYGRPIGTHHDSFERYHSRPPTVVSSYRPSIVTFPLSLCVSEILSLLCSTFIYIFIHRKR